MASMAPSGTTPRKKATQEPSPSKGFSGLEGWADGAGRVDIEGGGCGGWILRMGAVVDMDEGFMFFLFLCFFPFFPSPFSLISPHKGKPPAE